MSKDQILAKYLNTIYFGHGAYGIQAAARDLLRQAGEPADGPGVRVARGRLTRRPTCFDPIDRPSDDWYRRNYALDQMAQYGYLDDAQDTH